MRKIIIIMISVIFIGFGFLFVNSIKNSLNDYYITSDGELQFEYSKITSLSMPNKDTKIITSLDELKPIVDEHNFNVKHSYIYARIDADNKHNYKVASVIKNPTQINIIIQKTNAPENINLDTVPIVNEYIVDITGVIKDKNMPVVLNVIDN